MASPARLSPELWQPLDDGIQTRKTLVNIASHYLNKPSFRKRFYEERRKVERWQRMRYFNPIILDLHACIQALPLGHVITIRPIRNDPTRAFSYFVLKSIYEKVCEQEKKKIGYPLKKLAHAPETARKPEHKKEFEKKDLGIAPTIARERAIKSKIARKHRKSSDLQRKQGIVQREQGIGSNF